MILTINIVADNLYRAQRQATALADLMYSGRAKPMGWGSEVQYPVDGKVRYDTEFRFEVPNG